MRWRGERQSDNIEDRRGLRLGRPGLAAGGLGTIAIVVIGMMLGVDPGVLLQGLQQGGEATGPATQTAAPYEESADESERRQFVAVVLADTEAVWQQLFRARGGTYREPRLVLFSDTVQSGCGYAEAAMGPFYCPADDRVFLDMSFFDEMSGRLEAGGDFARAYVIAHEVGHHVQNLLGASGKVHEMQQRVGRVEANQLSVRLELQADCYAGVWANRAEQNRAMLESGDLEEAMGAASAVGDDRLQRQARGRVVPDSFTHGSSEQRMRWFRRGFQDGDPEACDTFAAADL
ncbi:MAG: neutral zinc metallopeptidase [Steroidobacteraceae bacterium]